MKKGNKLVTSRAASGTPLNKASITNASKASDGDFESTWGVSAKSTVVSFAANLVSQELF